ncbi:MAG: hypothetical protein D3904_11210 [Candidatus Electrothrix sp. EH2]|nr:hypothetical protein [Candidatus Electrothrix sp. EH2]
MKNSRKRLLFINGSAALASCIVSTIIISISYYYSLNLFLLIIVPLPGGFLAAYLVVFLLEEKEGSDLIRDFRHTLLLGITVALLTTVGFICSTLQDFLFFPELSP